MIRVCKEFSFDAAHRLQGHSRLCQYLHGHTWKIQVMVESEDLNSEGSSRGMVIDFSELKARVQGLIETMDHSVILEDGDPLISVLLDAGQRVLTVPFRPTAENFAREIVKALGVPRVRVYETPTNYAEAFDENLKP